MHTTLSKSLLCWAVLASTVGGLAACAAPGAPSVAPVTSPASETLLLTPTLAPTSALSRTVSLPTTQPTMVLSPTHEIPTLTTTASVTPSETPANQASPTPRPSDTPTATVTTTASSGATTRLNLDTFLPRGQARDLFLNNCTACHSFVCAVLGQRTIEHWEYIKRTHRTLITSPISDADYGLVFTYLEQNFSDSQPEPELPPELIGGSCTPH